MNIERAYERAEQELVDAYNRGDMDEPTFRAEMRSMAWEYRQEAEAAAEEAYYNELSRW